VYWGGVRCDSRTDAGIANSCARRRTDFIPVAGQLDDVVIVALVLRSLLRGGGEPIVREHWPGPDASLALVVRLGG
jgi:hypothetical protein